MIVIGAEDFDLDLTLAKVNDKFEDNVIWNRAPEYIGQTRYKEPKYRLTLRVDDSSAKGARRGNSGRKMISACWHVHGTFFDALPPGTTVLLGSGVRTAPGQPWIDRNIGSLFQPLYYSEACECGL